MAEKISLDRLNKVLNDFHDAQSKKDAQGWERGYEEANKIFQQYVSGELELDDETLDAFCELLNTFAATLDKDGNTVVSELGQQAMDKYNKFLDEQQVAPEIVKNRVYSLNSDANQTTFDAVSFVVLQQMGLIAANTDVKKLSPSEITKEIDKIQLTDKQKIEYSARFVDAVIADLKQFECVPPAVLADAYVATRKALVEAKDEKTKQAFAKRFKTLASRIDFLISNFSTMFNYWYVDPSNLMDVRDGYEKMFDVRQPDLKEHPSQNQKTKEHNKKINDEINNGRDRLTSAIKEYEELYHLTTINPDNAEELKERWIELKKRLGEIEITPETMAVAAKYQFLDDQGKPIPQFLDENGQPLLEYKEGCKLDPKGRLAQVINLSRNDVVMENVADLAHPVEKMELDKMLDEEVPWTFSEISIPDQVTNGIIQDPKKMQNEAAVQELWDEIKTEGGNISDAGYQAALDAHVNHAVGFAKCLGDKVGMDKDVVYLPLEAIEEIDKYAETRTEVEGAKGREQKIGLFKRAAKNFGMGAVVSAGMTFLAKATGVAYIGAAIGTTIGIGNMIYQGVKWRKEQQEAGKPHGLKEFFSDKRNWGPAITTGLGIAATISMATGNPELAMGFGLGAVVSGTGTSVVTTYNDAIKAGYTRGQALAGSIFVGASGILGAFVGRVTMNGIINYVNENTNSTLFKHEETIENGTRNVYAEGVVEKNERMMLRHGWETPQSLEARIDSLIDTGMSRDDAVRWILAWHDATDHNLGPEYFRSIGMTNSDLAALRASISGTNVNITPEAIAAFDKFNPHISAINQVGHVDGAPIIADGSLPANASYVNGVAVTGNDFYTTFANHDAPILTQVPVLETIMVANEAQFPQGLATMGIYEKRLKAEQDKRTLRHRPGSLADKEEQIKVGPGPKPGPRPNPNPIPRPDPHPDPVPPIKKEYDLTIQLKSNPEAVRKHESVDISGKMKTPNVSFEKEVVEGGVRFSAVVPYDVDTPKGFFKVVNKSFTKGPIDRAIVKSYAKEDGIHIEVFYEGVSFENAGKFRLDFEYVGEDRVYEEIITKKTRFKKVQIHTPDPVVSEGQPQEKPEVTDQHAQNPDAPNKPEKTEQTGRKKNKRKKGFEQGTRTIAEKSAADIARENIAVWDKARKELEALEVQTDLTEQEKSQRAAKILAMAQQNVEA